MKTATSALIAALLLAASPARAADGSERGRGWLTGLGLGLTATSAVGLGLGLAGLLSAGDANTTLNAYVGNGRVLQPSEAATAKQLQERVSSAQTLATVGFIVSGVSLAGAITCLVLDGLGSSQPVAVGLTPLVGGGALLVSGHF